MCVNMYGWNTSTNKKRENVYNWSSSSESRHLIVKQKFFLCLCTSRLSRRYFASLWPAILHNLLQNLEGPSWTPSRNKQSEVQHALRETTENTELNLGLASVQTRSLALQRNERLPEGKLKEKSLIIVVSVESVKKIKLKSNW